MDKNKPKALELLNKKKTHPNLTYEMIEGQTGYSKRQLLRLNKELQQKDMESILTHGNTGKAPAITASYQEISYLRKLKEPYPHITIAQFRDFYFEDVLNNPKKQSVVKRYHLKSRSKSWFRELFRKEGWTSPLSRKTRRDDRAIHPLRQPSPQRGMISQIDGTPFDWFGDGRMYTLHLSVDDATTEVLAGWFMPTECQSGYCHMMRLEIEKNGIPKAIYSDRHTIFKNIKDGSKTQFGLMMDRLGIRMIFAGSPEAKGRIERCNGTCQRRLPNDIIRFHIKTYDQLNIWFNEFYISYLNSKFAFNPVDPNSAYAQIEPDFDYSRVFYATLTRTISSDTFSIANNLYSVLNEYGEVMHIRDRLTVDVRIDAFTRDMYVWKNEKRYELFKVGQRRIHSEEIIENQKDLTDYINKKDK